MAANTLIFGGSGKCARHVTRLLVAEGHNVHSIIRKQEQVPEIEGLGGKPIVQSIEDSSVDDMVKTIKATKASAVLWCAGAGGGSPERTKAVDNEGAIRSMDATSQAGVKRFIIISAIDVRDRSKPEPSHYNDADRKRSDGVWTAIKPAASTSSSHSSLCVSTSGRKSRCCTLVSSPSSLRSPIFQKAVGPQGPFGSYCASNQLPMTPRAERTPPT